MRTMWLPASPGSARCAMTRTVASNTRVRSCMESRARGRVAPTSDETAGWPGAGSACSTKNLRDVNINVRHVTPSYRANVSLGQLICARGHRRCSTGKRGQVDPHRASVGQADHMVRAPCFRGAGTGRRVGRVASRRARCRPGARAPRDSAQRTPGAAANSIQCRAPAPTDTPRAGPAAHGPGRNRRPAPTHPQAAVRARAGHAGPNAKPRGLVCRSNH